MPSHTHNGLMTQCTRLPGQPVFPGVYCSSGTVVQPTLQVTSLVYLDGSPGKQKHGLSFLGRHSPCTHISTIARLTKQPFPRPRFISRKTNKTTVSTSPLALSVNKISLYQQKLGNFKPFTHSLTSTIGNRLIDHHIFSRVERVGEWKLKLGVR